MATKLRILSKRNISAIFTVLFILLISWFIGVNWAEFTQLKLVNPELLILLIITILLNLFATGLLMSDVLRPLSVSLSVSVAFGLSVLTRIGNYLILGYAGLGIRGWYLKKHHDLSYTAFTSSLIASHIFLLFFSALLGLLSLSIIDTSQESVLPTIMLWLLILIASILPITFLFRTRIKKLPLPNLFRGIGAGLSSIGTSWSSIFKISVWTLAMIVSFSMMTFLEFNLLNYEISMPAALFITSVGSLNAVLNITPAGFGVTESLILLAAQAIGVPTSVALGTSLVRRGMVFLVTAILATHFSPKLLNFSIFNYHKKII